MGLVLPCDREGREGGILHVQDGQCVIYQNGGWGRRDIFILARVLSYLTDRENYIADGQVILTGWGPGSDS